MRNEFNIEHARSLNNGIIFYSKQHRNHIALATIDEQGNIYTEWTTLEDYKKREKKRKTNKQTKSEILQNILILCLVIFLIISITITFGKRFLLIAYPLAVLISFFFKNFQWFKKERDSFKFHSAEHMVVNAYHDFNRVLSKEEVVNFSRFHNNRSTNLITIIILICILLFFCTFIENKLYRFIVGLLASFIVIIFSQLGLLNFLQKFTTLTPTDRELEVAIVGMNFWLENEKKE